MLLKIEVNESYHFLDFSEYQEFDAKTKMTDFLKLKVECEYREKSILMALVEVSEYQDFFARI